MSDAGTIVYITSQFPVLSETFIAREIIELERRGFEVLVVPLGSKPQTVEKQELPRAEVVHKRYLSAKVLAGAFSELVRSPLAVLRHSTFLAVRLRRRPARLIKFVGILPKTLYLMGLFREKRVVHIHSHWATLPTTCALFLSLVTKAPFSFAAHAWDIHVDGNELLLREKVERADRVFTCTKYNKLRLAEFGPEDKIEVMYHGIEIDRYDFESTKVLSPPLILAGTSLVPQKGLDDFVSALAILRRNGVPFRSEILGRGIQQNALESQITAEGLGDVVELIGTRKHHDVIDLMRRAAVFVMPSKRAPGGFIDGLPNVIAEAMACGACVVATRFSGIPELVDDGVNGLLVEPGDFGALAGAIENVLEDNNLREKMSRKARARVEEMFDLKKNVKPIADYFERLLAHGRDFTNV
jgi:glycosyltransferase involved in cell wall biosynthesis